MRADCRSVSESGNIKAATLKKRDGETVHSKHSKHSKHTQVPDNYIGLLKENKSVSKH